MRRNSDAGVGGQGACSGARGLQQRGKPIDRIAKPQLPGGQRLLTRAAIGVKHRQMRQADTRQLGCGKNAVRKLGNVGVSAATRLMMHIMEFTNGGVPGLLHFHEHKGGNRLHLFRRQAVQKTVHQIAPRPETVTARDAVFGHARHRALERMAVQV